MNEWSRSWWGNLRKRDHLEDVGLDVKIMLLVERILKKISWKVVEWNDLTEGTEKWRALVKAVMNLRVPKNARNFLTVEELSFSGWTPFRGIRLIDLIPRSEVHP
jgi:hypothetical protein